MTATAQSPVAQNSFSSEARLQLVTFALEARNYCVDIMSVREIRILEDVTPVPGTHPDVLGVINLRGSIVPVIDLRFRFGLGRTPIKPQNPSVIVAIGGRLFALLVDSVNDIVSVSADDFAPVPDARGGNASSLFRSVVRTETGMLILVDLDGLAARTGEAAAGQGSGHAK